jgi:glycosyltransferase involved in cell wall biosynthesis
MKVAVVSPYPVPPATNGATARIERLTSWILHRGHDIHYVWAPTAPYAADPATLDFHLTETWGSTTILPEVVHPEEPSGGDDWHIDDWVGEVQRAPFQEAMEAFRPDVVLVNYIFLSKFLDWSPSSSLRYLDSHDRLSRRQLYEDAGISAGFFYTSEAEELDACRRADVVFAIQDNELDHFASSGRPIAVVGHPEPANYRSSPGRETGVKIGAIAGHNKFNILAFDELIEELRRTDVLRRRGATLSIAGSLTHVGLLNGKYQDLPEGVEAVGLVEDLDSFYDSVDLVINPITLGTGLKIKTVEALAKGKPLLSTSTGTDGIPVHTPSHDCEDVPALVTRLDDLLEDPGRNLNALANVSRNVHSEYQLALEQNLIALFDPAVLAAHSENRLGSYIASRTSPLDPAVSRGLTLRDPLLGGIHQQTMVHVLNPAPTRYDTDLYSAQPVTFESMRRAAGYARLNRIDVDLVAVLGGEENVEVPHGFTRATRRARPVTRLYGFNKRRPFPLLADILEIGAEESDSEWMIYTNADIAVLPHFYTYVSERIAEGHDAMVINRRTIDRDDSDISKLERMNAKIGEKHPGYDCFVFRRALVDSFELGDVCIGVHLVGRVLLWNLLAHARNPILIEDAHVTFHLGDDNSGKSPEFVDYIEHNSSQAVRAMAKVDESDETRRRFDRALKSFPSNLLALNFNRSILVTDDGDLRPQFADRPIFIHSLFRTGSTFLWTALRSSPHQKTYYEPLHEELSYLSPETLDRYKARHTLTTRHRLDGEWLFAEYEPLLQPGRVGVPGYRRQMAYESYADNSPQPVMRAYFDHLIAQSGPRQPILKMTRSALRQRWFHREYPGAHHLYLTRDHREQWASYLTFMTETARGFARNDAIICGLNKDRALVKPLNSLVNLVELPTSGDFFTLYDEVFDRYSWADRYTLFYYLWLQGLLEAAATGSFIVDMNAVAAGRSQRMRLESYLGVRGAQVGMGHFEMTGYDHDLPLDAPEMSAIERRVEELLVATFGASRFRRLTELDLPASTLRTVLDLVGA